MTYRIAPRAEADLDAILAYIVERNPPAARRVIERFTVQWELLATQPRSGAERDDVLAGIRHKVSGPYVAFYRVEGDDILILRVLHGKRDLTAENPEDWPA